MSHRALCVNSDNKSHRLGPIFQVAGEALIGGLSVTSVDNFRFLNAELITKGVVYDGKSNSCRLQPITQVTGESLIGATSPSTNNSLFLNENTNTSDGLDFIDEDEESSYPSSVVDSKTSPHDGFDCTDGLKRSSYPSTALDSKIINEDELAFIDDDEEVSSQSAVVDSQTFNEDELAFIDDDEELPSQSAVVDSNQPSIDELIKIKSPLAVLWQGSESKLKDIRSVYAELSPQIEDFDADNKRSDEIYMNKLEKNKMAPLAVSELSPQIEGLDADNKRLDEIYMNKLKKINRETLLAEVVTHNARSKYTDNRDFINVWEQNLKRELKDEKALPRIFEYVILHIAKGETFQNLIKPDTENNNKFFVNGELVNTSQLDQIIEFSVPIYDLAQLFLLRTELARLKSPKSNPFERLLIELETTNEFDRLLSSLREDIASVVKEIEKGKDRTHSKTIRKIRDNILQRQNAVEREIKIRSVQRMLIEGNLRESLRSAISTRIMKTIVRTSQKRQAPKTKTCRG